MRAQTILFLLVDRVRGKLDCRPYRDGGEGNPKRLVEAASLAFSNRSIFLTIRGWFSNRLTTDCRRVGSKFRCIRSTPTEMQSTSENLSVLRARECTRLRRYFLIDEVLTAPFPVS